MWYVTYVYTSIQWYVSSLRVFRFETLCWKEPWREGDMGMGWAPQWGAMGMEEWQGRLGSFSFWTTAHYLIASQLISIKISKALASKQLLSCLFQAEASLLHLLPGCLPVPPRRRMCIRPFPWRVPWQSWGPTWLRCRKSAKIPENSKDQLRISAPLLDDAEEQQLPVAMTDEFFMYKYKILRWNTLDCFMWLSSFFLWNIFLQLHSVVCLIWTLNHWAISTVLALQDSLVPHWCPTRMAQLQPGWKIPGWSHSTNQCTSGYYISV